MPRPRPGASRKAPQSRTKRMADLYATGATLEEVGNEFGLTRERVRQVLVQGGYDLAKLRAKASRIRWKRILDEEVPAIRSKLASGLTPAEVAGVLDVPLEVVRRVDATNSDYARQRKALRVKSASAKYTDDEVLECLRSANQALGGVLAAAAYTDFARGRTFTDGRPWPTHQTAHLRFGSWRRALREAGLPANPSSPIAGRRLFNEGHCIDA